MSDKEIILEILFVFQLIVLQLTLSDYICIIMIDYKSGGENSNETGAF